MKKTKAEIKQMIEKKLKQENLDPKFREDAELTLKNINEIIPDKDQPNEPNQQERVYQDDSFLPDSS